MVSLAFTYAALRAMVMPPVRSPPATKLARTAEVAVAATTRRGEQDSASQADGIRALVEIRPAHRALPSAMAATADPAVARGLVHVAVGLPS